MNEKFWNEYPQEQRLYFEMAESERKFLENQLQSVTEKLENLKEYLQSEKRMPEEISRAMNHRHGGDDLLTPLEAKIRALEARIRVLETENEYLRAANAALATGKTPAEAVIETTVPDKKIKAPGRPGINPWESGQMKKLRKEGWTIREIAERYGRSIGAVQKIVADVAVDPDKVTNHRAERNKALTDARLAVKAAKEGHA